MNDLETLVEPMFAAWAASWAGCDGGNLQGGIWFVGIEPGGQDQLTADSFNTPWPSMPAWDDRQRHAGMGFNQRMLKLYAAMQGRGEDWRALAADSAGPFSADGDTCKFNLYPLAFPRDNELDWTAQLVQLTGLPTKRAYQTWCRLYRFPTFQAAVAEYRPRCIVGIGRGYLEDYAWAFGGLAGLRGHMEALAGPKANSVVAGNRDFSWCRLAPTNTLLAVIPFLGGRNGLSADADIQATGQAIASLLT